MSGNVALVTNKGSWNALTNAPAISNSTQNNSPGDYYTTSVAGTSSFTSRGKGQYFSVGDIIVYNGAVWTKNDQFSVESGYGTPANWKAAYDDHIISGSFANNTITLNQKDGGSFTIDLTGVGGSSVLYRDSVTVSASSGQNAFTLSASIDSEDKTQVFIDGVYQQKTAYSVSGTTLAFDGGVVVPQYSTVEIISFSSVALTESLANAKIFVGDANANAIAKTISGDATLANTGALTLNTVPLAKGGTGATSAAAARTSLGLGSVATTASTDYATSAQGTKADTAHGWGDHGSGGYITGITFANVSSKPTTLSGYGITDAAPIASPTFSGSVTAGGDAEIITSSTPTLQLTQSGSTNYKGYIKLGGNDLEIRGSSGAMEFYNGSVDGNSSALRMSISSTGLATFQSSTQGKIKLIASSNEYLSLEFANNSGTTQWEISKNNTHDLYFYKGGYKMMLKAGGNVGIGITTPLHALHVKANQNVPATIETPNANTWLDLKSTNGTWSLGSMSGNAFGVYNRTDNTNPFKILNSGNVGIGTVSTDPQHKLNVQVGTDSRLGVFGNGTYVGIGAVVDNNSAYRAMKLYATDYEFRIGNTPKLTISSGGSTTFTSRANFNGNVNVVSANAEIWIGESTGGGGAGFLKWNDAGNYLYLGNSYNSAFNTDLVISSIGNVGIGTADPNDGKLQVYGNSSSDWAGYFFNQSTSGIGVHIEANSGGTQQVFRTSSRPNGGGNAVTMAVLANGNVGIGTDDPSNSKLTISDGVAGYSSANILLQVKRNATNSNDDTSKAAILIGNISNAFQIAYGGTTDRLRFINGGSTEQLTLLNGGNVGIGATSPSARLQVQGAINTTVGAAVVEVYTNLSSGTDAQMASNAGGANIHMDVNNFGSSSSGNGIIWKTKYANNAGYTKTSAAIKFQPEGNYFRGGLGFYTNNTQNATTNAVERMRISSAGYVTKPYQVAFQAYHNAGDINYSPGNLLPYQNVLFNIGSGYNASTSTFTAPVAGRYLFSANANGNYSSSYGGIPRAYWQINSTNVGYAIHLRGPDATDQGLEQRSQTVIFNLSANDTVRIKVLQNQWDLFGANSFCGYLLG